MNVCGRFCCVMVAAVLSAGHAVAAHDVVEFEGGNRLVGEVKRLERGRLYFDTVATDDIPIDWMVVTRLVSAQRLRLEDADGKRILGSLAESAVPGSLSVVTGADIVEVPIASIVNIDPIEQTAWERTDVEAAAGWSFTNSTGVREWNVDVDVDYESERHSRALSLSSQSTGSDEEDDSIRHVIEGETFVLHDDLWLTGWLVGAEQNDALGLELRAVGAFGGGRRFFPSTSQRAMLVGGLQLNQERFEGGGPQSSLELLLYGKFDWYRFQEPELDLSSRLLVLPGLTELGRIRARFEIALDWEFVEDVFWRLSFYNDYDSDARDAGGSDSSENINYGFTTGIGWSH